MLASFISVRLHPISCHLGLTHLLHTNAIHCEKQRISAVHHPLLAHLLHPPASSLLCSWDAVKALHAMSITSSPLLPISVNHTLISAYAAHRDLRSARDLFERMPHRTSISYNSLISSYCRCGCVNEAFALLPRMMDAGLQPTIFTFAPVLSLPSLDICRGQMLHTLILKFGLIQVDPFSGTALQGLYSRYGRLDEAINLFEEMSIKTVATWNSLISAFSQRGFVDDSMFLFRQLLRTSVGLTEYSFLSVISAFCSSDNLEHVEQIHVHAIKTGMDSFLVVSNALIHVFCSCFRVHIAEQLFSVLKIRDVVSWNTMIAGFAKSVMPERACELFLTMQTDAIWPNKVTFSSVLNACTGLASPKCGEAVHAKAIKYNLDTSAFVGSSLIDFYAKWRSLGDAHQMFIEIPEKNVVCWNALISGYSNDDSHTSLVLLKEMLQSDVKPNEFSFSSGLKQASSMELQQIHSLIIKMGYDSNEYVSCGIVASYASDDLFFDISSCSTCLDPPISVTQMNAIAGNFNREGRHCEAKQLLLQLHTPDIISWNILLTACTRNGDYLEAFQFFKYMQSLGFLFDNYTAMSLVSICAKINSLELGRSLHGLIIKTISGCMDTFVCNLLLNMYAKCGSLEGCLKVFAEMDERNLITWTALISGLGLHGHPHEALAQFKQMEFEGFKPDKVALLAVLSACRHGGLVEEGMLLFHGMKSDYGIEPEMDHYVCLVDLLCKHGHLKEAELVISEIPFQPNAIIWRTFLQGCKRFGGILT